MVTKKQLMAAMQCDLDMIRSAITWPRFSLTSYLMVRDLVRQGIAPNTVIDVGANAGQFSVAASRLFRPGQIYAFEPVPDCFSALVKNTERLKNVSAHKLAFGRRIEEAQIHVNSFRQSSSLLALGALHHAEFPEEVETATVPVSVTTMDDFFRRIDLVGNVMLKIDVQGSEADVLAGGSETLGRVDLVLMEVSFRPMYEGEAVFRDLLGTMESLGFEFERPVGWLTSQATNEVLQMDALFRRRAAMPTGPGRINAGRKADGG